MELGYAQITSNSDNSGTTERDVPGLSVTVTVGTRPIWVEIGAELRHITASTGPVILYIKEGSTKFQQAAINRIDPNQESVSKGVRLTPAAGTHTYKVSMLAPIGTGGGRIIANGTTPAYISVCER
jgi:hypothetical protein